MRNQTSPYVKSPTNIAVIAGPRRIIDPAVPTDMTAELLEPLEDADAVDADPDAVVETPDDVADIAVVDAAVTVTSPISCALGAVEDPLVAIKYDQPRCALSLFIAKT